MAIEIVDFTHKKWEFSIVMLVYQRGSFAKYCEMTRKPRSSENHAAILDTDWPFEEVPTCSLGNAFIHHVSLDHFEVLHTITLCRYRTSYKSLGPHQLMFTKLMSTSKIQTDLRLPYMCCASGSHRHGDFTIWHWSVTISIRFVHPFWIYKH